MMNAVAGSLRTDAASRGVLLDVVEVTKRFAGSLALDHVSLQIGRGELRAVIGPNGAGKSTLFGVVSGEHRVDSGRITFAGKDVTRLVADRRVRMGISRAFQVARIFPALSVIDNITAAVLAARGLSGSPFGRRALAKVSAEANGLAERTGLAGLAGRTAATLSQGDRKRLEITMALATQPTLLLLDEPTAGMSPAETDHTVELVRDLWRDTGVTVVLTEHDMDVVFGLAEQVTVLHLGSVLTTGSPAEVRSDPEVERVYLGTDSGGEAEATPWTDSQ